MPMQMSVGLSKKVGEANFGSRGATVNFQVELEANLVREPEQLREKIRYLFRLANEAVAEELGCHGRPAADSRNSNGHHNNGNGNGSRRSHGRTATQSQVRAIRAIASKQRIDLDAELRNRFGVDRLDDLTIGEASDLIDSIKPASDSNGARR